MNLLLACRVCLAHDIRLFSIKDGQFRDIYEKLVEASLDTEDMLPTSVCYICFASMKKMLQFRNRSQKANQLLQRMISSGLELTFSSLDMLVKYQTGITWSLKISEVERTTTTSAEDEVKVKIESVESEMGIDGTSDWNEAADLARTPMYPFPGSIPVPCPISLSPEMSETKKFLSHNLQHELNRFSPTLDGDLGLEPLSKAEIDSFQSHYERSLEMGSSSSSSDNPAESSAANSEEQNKNVEEFATITSQPHIKKPLNAFMLYMKEMRAKVAAECNSTVSSAINQTLGKQWKSLSREEQAKYYEKARQELKRHMQLYPGWRISKKMSRELGCSSFATITSQPHIKKPLNAFMLYMKEMRPKVAAECNSTESSVINQILGKQWHALGSEEQAKYYELARRERLLHKQLYPGWSSRGRKRRRRGAKDPSDAANILKKCRARYGLDQQDQWCEPCKRKKKCVRYMEALAAAAGSAARPMATPQSPCSEEDVKLIMEELLDASDDDGDVDTPLNSASSPASDPPPAPPHPVGTNPRDASYPLSVSQLLRAFRTGIDKHTRPLSPKYMSN